MGLFEDDEEYKKERAKMRMRRADMMGKWVMVMFRLQIVAIIGGVLSSDLFEKVPIIYLLGELISFGIMIANSVILIRLKEVEDEFGKAGIGYLICGCSGILIALLTLGGAGVLATLVTLVMAFVALKADYDECTGYEVSLWDINKELSEQWMVQWKLELICTLSTWGIALITLLGTLFQSVGFLFLCLILLLIAVIATFCVGIRRLIYLHRTAVCFQNYVPDEELQ